MIVAKNSIKEYIKAHPTMEGLAEKLDTNRTTLYSILKGESISGEIISKLLTETGFDFEKAFEVKE